MHSTEVLKTRLGQRVLTEDGFSSEFSSAVEKQGTFRLFIASEGPPGGQLLESPSKDPKGSKDHRTGFNSIFQMAEVQSQTFLPLQKYYSQCEPN